MSYLLASLNPQVECGLWKSAPLPLHPGKATEKTENIRQRSKRCTPNAHAQTKPHALIAQREYKKITSNRPPRRPAASPSREALHPASPSAEPPRTFSLFQPGTGYFRLIQLPCEFF
jgi:hypothetical protein